MATLPSISSNLQEVELFYSRCKDLTKDLPLPAEDPQPVIIEIHDYRRHDCHYHDSFWDFYFHLACWRLIFDSGISRPASRSDQLQVAPVLIAIGIIAVIGVLFFAAYHYGQVAYDTGQNMTEDQRIITLVRHSEETSLNGQIQRLAENLLMIDTQKFHKNAAYCPSLATLGCGAFVAIGGFFLGSSMLVTAGAVVAIAGATIGVVCLGYYSIAGNHQELLRRIIAEQLRTITPALNAQIHAAQER